MIAYEINDLRTLPRQLAWAIHHADMLEPLGTHIMSNRFHSQNEMLHAYCCMAWNRGTFGHCRPVWCPTPKFQASKTQKGGELQPFPHQIELNRCRNHGRTEPQVVLPR